MGHRGTRQGGTGHGGTGHDGTGHGGRDTPRWDTVGRNTAGRDTARRDRTQRGGTGHSGTGYGGTGQDGTGTCEMKGIFSVQSATVQIDTFLIWFGFHYFSKWISLAADFKDLALYNVHASSAWSIQLECVWQTMLIENSKTVFPKLSTWKHQRGQSKIWKEQK